jgi:cobalt/nickel transport system permease protein
MHMADALLSPSVGGAMWTVSAGTIAFCSGKVRSERDDRKIPLMGVLGAFIFAAQMINFTIPGTGSSGHLGGGLILTVLLGPCAAFLTIASVLVVQALFFADGGLLALGCNIFNLGFFPAFLAYPLIYKKLLGNRPTSASITCAALVTAITGLQLGSFAVVLETAASGVASLPLSAFITVMQPIHLAIGIVEGLVTASVVIFVSKTRPEIIHSGTAPRTRGVLTARNLTLTFLILALITGGLLSRFASMQPDGLAWSISRVTGRQEPIKPEKGLQTTLSGLQQKLAVLPDYSFRKPGRDPHAIEAKTNSGENRLDTGLSGLVGGLATLGLSLLVGILLKKRSSIP